LTGDGAYEGLSAILSDTSSSWPSWTVAGAIFPGPLPLDSGSAQDGAAVSMDPVAEEVEPVAAGAGVAEPVPFTVRFSWLDREVRSSQDVIADGLTKRIDGCWAMGTFDPSDPRIGGELTWCSDEHIFAEVRAEETRDTSPLV
jgi:hypothetical protein